MARLTNRSDPVYERSAAATNYTLTNGSNEGVGAASSPSVVRFLDNGPHAKRGRLNNGNPSGDLSNAPRCGAKTRHGSLCRGPAMRNGRCRMHGGRSTGPRTSAGLRRSRKARWKTGAYSSKSKKAHREAMASLRYIHRFCEMFNRYDSMMEYLEEIENQINAGRSEGLMANCIAARGMWLRHLVVMKEGEILNGSRRRKKSKSLRLEETVTLLLEAGARGEGLDELRKIGLTYPKD